MWPPAPERLEIVSASSPDKARLHALVVASKEVVRSHARLRLAQSHLGAFPRPA